MHEAVLLLDASLADHDTRALVSTIHAQFPDLAIIVAGRRDDEAGLAVADRLKQRVEASIACEIALPPKAYPDWNDWARAEMG
mgnify:CR=1 FL=1